MGALRRCAFVVGAVATFTACPAPSDYTPQIRIVPGAAARIGLFASKTAHEVATPARVHAMRAGEELGGPNAVGKPGDLVIENGEVVVVIDALGAGLGFAESGGNIVDAADAAVRDDELGQVFTAFGTFPRQAVYDRITSGVLPDGAAFVEASGRELVEAKLAVTTRYTLRPGDRALLLETTLTNRSDHPIPNLRLGDALQWGGAEKFAPGKSVGFHGASSGPFVGGVGRDVSYAITSTEGSIDAVSGSSWTDTMQTPALILKPNEHVRYARVLVVGARGDTASVVAELGRVAGAKAGGLEVAFVDDAGRPLRVGGRARVVLATPKGDEVLSLASRAEDEIVEGDVPPGLYVVAYASGGGRRGLATSPVEVSADHVTRVTLPLSAAGRLIVHGVEGTTPTPCKTTIEGVEGTATPNFGAAHHAGPARNQVTTGANGICDVPIAPGHYRVSVSRGPEYALVQSIEAVAPDATTETTAHLVRVVDTRGYLATDFHQHTMLGADAPVGTRDRVIANAAEGVEVAVASEHNIVADLEPLVRELSLTPWLVEVPGNEITTDANVKPWGHANVFPLDPQPNAPRGGATPIRDRTPRDVFAEVRKSPSPRVVQINHPRTGLTGYFDQLGFDLATGTGTNPDYDGSFDALEVWNGRNVEGRDKVLADFFALLRAGHPVTATADTDTHGVVGHEAGYPRTYVAVANDGELASWDATRAADLVASVRERRDVVLTNGPFLRVRIAGMPIGSVARATRKRVKMTVHIECAPWVDVNEAHLVRALAPTAIVKRENVRLTALPSGAVGADLTWLVDAPTDDAFVVIATGTRPLTPVLSGDENEIRPFAMTGAVWIDADGDGASLGRTEARAAKAKDRD